jgi:hypothetical protein
VLTNSGSCMFFFLVSQTNGYLLFVIRRHRKTAFTRLKRFFSIHIYRPKPAPRMSGKS